VETIFHRKHSHFTRCDFLRHISCGLVMSDFDDHHGQWWRIIKKPRMAGTRLKINQVTDSQVAI